MSAPATTVANGGPPPSAPSAAAETAGGPNVSSLSEMEWKSMEVPLENATKNTHLSLQKWLTDRARVLGIRARQADDEDSEEDGDDDAGEEDTSPNSSKTPGGRAAGGDKAANEGAEEKNWSAVNLAFQESKLSWKATFNPGNFTNWLWNSVVRVRLDETKGNVDAFAEQDLEEVLVGIEAVQDVLGEFIPQDQKKKEKKDKDADGKKDKKGDKKDKKDDKKDKKEDKKKEEKGGKDAKKKKPAVVLNAKEKLQASNLIKSMVFGEGKAKAMAGWANLIGDKEIPSNSPWDFQLAQVLFKGLTMEYRFKKKKETPDVHAYYDQMQSLADSINQFRKQLSYFFKPDEVEQFLPIRDALLLQDRLQSGSAGIVFDLEWYMKNGAHLLAGSSFAKKHVGRTSFQPFRIQEQMSDAILTEGPQLVWGIAPPGTGKTAVVPHLLNLFPDHTLVFVCAALPVVLGVGQVATSLGLPYALVKNKRITPAFSCGHKLGHHVDVEDMRAVQSLRDTVIQMNLDRKKDRLRMVKRKRRALDFKRMPRIWLVVCDIMSSSWIIEQLDPLKTILVIDEPPMGSDKVPGLPEENPMAMNMAQAMMNPMYKTILMSATMPRSHQLPSIVENFTKRFNVDAKKCVRECFSTQLDRGVVLVRPSGRIAFPHELCETSAQLKALADRLPGDPLTLKAYTERALSQLLIRWRVLEKVKIAPANWAPPVRPSEKFKDLSQLKPETIREYAMELLSAVAKTGDDRFAKEFCAIELSEDVQKEGEFKEEKEAAQFPAYDVKELLFGNAHAFPGVTLVADDKPAEILERMAEKLIAQMPKAKELDSAVDEINELAKKQQKLAEKQAGNKDDGSEQVEFFSADSQSIKFDSSLVLHTEQFLKRWCPKAKKESLMYPRMVPTVGDYKLIQALPVDDKWRMLALSGAAAFDPVLDKDPAQPVYTQWVHDKMLANKLSCVTAGKEFTWGANLPASTVVVTSSFANSTSVSGMLQYVGRAARRGLTTHGQALFEDDESLNRILKKGAQQMSTEADTMERYAKWILGGKKAEAWSCAGEDIA